MQMPARTWCAPRLPSWHGVCVDVSPNCDSFETLLGHTHIHLHTHTVAAAAAIRLLARANIWAQTACARYFAQKHTDDDVQN